MWSLLLTWAKTTGVFGVSVGAVVLIFYKIVTNRLSTPNQNQSAKLLRLIIICIFSIGVLGIIAWILIILFVPEKDRSPYLVESVIDTVDFTNWEPTQRYVAPNARTSPNQSLVSRVRTITVRKLTSTDDPFLDRSTTTGDWIRADIPSEEVAFNEVARLWSDSKSTIPILFSTS
jgi:hypothetical protein